MEAKSARTIMVVDDNPDIIAIVGKMLENKGYSVISATGGPQALELLQGVRPDLMILDIMMPEMDGLEVLTHMKEARETSLIPVILLTVKRTHEDVIEGYKRGCDYYVTKPFAPSHLLNGVRLVLGEPLERKA